MAIRIKRQDYLDDKKLVQTEEQVYEMLEKGEISTVAAFSLVQDIKRSTAKPAPGKDKEKDAAQRLAAIQSELDTLIGLAKVKHLIKEIQAFVKVQKLREKENLTTEPLVLHMIFRGNPGTGKTTVARIIGKLFKEMGVLQKGHIIEVERADLVGEYIGHTAQKTREQLKKALGGILFIDEAYSLARGGEKDFGKEAIDTMVKAMEDHKDNLILILAGYQGEMTKFLQTNPGLRSRFPIHIDFPDYTVSELLGIADHMLSGRQYKMDSVARQFLKEILEYRLNHSNLNDGNARLVRNLIERAIRKQAMRLVRTDKLEREDLLTITNKDLEEAPDYV